MTSVNVYKYPEHRVKIEQTKIPRDWMDETVDRHAYRCFPVSFANTIGWSISFLDDIEFIWDGISDSSPDHVKIIKSGANICDTKRGNATVSFNSGLIFKTDSDMSILSIVPPNYFIDGATPFTSIISTSFYKRVYPIAWRITKPNAKILIPAGTPVATLIPLSIGKLSKIELNIYDKEKNLDTTGEDQEKLEVFKKMSNSGKPFSNFYRDYVDQKNNSLENHELKSLKLTINDFRSNPD